MTAARRWLVFLVLAGVVLRLGLWLVYEPIEYDDTGTYTEVAQHILTGDFSHYEARRPPGYPLVLALAGLSPRRAWALQSLMGLAVSVILFSMAYTLTRRPGFAALAGMSYNLNLSQLFFEAHLTSETTTTLVVTATAAMLLVLLRRFARTKRETAFLLGLGLVAGLSPLVRPQFAFLPVLVGALVAYASLLNVRHGLGASVRRACLVITPGIALLVGWAWINSLHVGYFTLTTNLGFNLMNHSMPFLESSPDRYAQLRDILIKYRDAKVARTGRHTMAIWEAVPALRAATGQSLPELSRNLQPLSLHLFVRNPVGYAASVARAWVSFWLAPNYWDLDRIRPASLAALLAWLWASERWLLRTCNLLFLLLAVAAALAPGARFRPVREFPLLAVAGIVLVTSLTQALVEYGENAKYAISVQPITVLALATALHRLLGRSATRALEGAKASPAHPLRAARLPAPAEPSRSVR